MIETGRFQDYSSCHCKASFAEAISLQTIFQRQLENCKIEIHVGPGRMPRWSVPDGTRDPSSEELIHDDLVISAALCSVLDDQPWGLAISEIIQGFDPLSNLSNVN